LKAATVLVQFSSLMKRGQYLGLYDRIGMQISRSEWGHRSDNGTSASGSLARDHASCILPIGCGLIRFLARRSIPTTLVPVPSQMVVNPFNVQLLGHRRCLVAAKHYVSTPSQKLLWDPKPGCNDSNVKVWCFPSGAMKTYKDN
jgi:hypothetical protein